MFNQFDTSVRLLTEQLLVHNNSVPNPFKIVFVHTSGGLPEYCSAVTFSPLPPTGTTVQTGFHSNLTTAYNSNASVHDGALGFEYSEKGWYLRLSAWGIRLFPPDLSNEDHPNRGMAFNSALHFSAVPRVLRVILFAGQQVEQFVRVLRLLRN